MKYFTKCAARLLYILDASNAFDKVMINGFSDSSTKLELLGCIPTYMAAPVLSRLHASRRLTDDPRRTRPQLNILICLPRSLKRLASAVSRFFRHYSTCGIFDLLTWCSIEVDITPSPWLWLTCFSVVSVSIAHNTSSGICITRGDDCEVFRSARVTRYTDGDEIWHGGVDLRIDEADIKCQLHLSETRGVLSEIFRQNTTGFIVQGPSLFSLFSFPVPWNMNPLASICRVSLN